MHPETTKLNRALVLSALQNIEAWERWANTVPSGASQKLNLSLIRLTKGLVKAWRAFLIDESQPQQSTIGSSQPTLSPSIRNTEAANHGKIRNS